MLTQVWPTIASSQNKWVWLGGSNVWGAKRSIVVDKGVAMTTNYPGSRSYFSMVFGQKQNLLYIFGGLGLSAFDGYLNDLWMLNFTSNEVTWLSGSRGPNTVAVHGLRGVPSASNIPAGRRGHVMVEHPTMNALLAFGGAYYGNYGYFYLNDLWMYEHSNNQWTWLSGNSSANVPGVYGTKGIPSASNYPGSRYGHAMVVHSTLSLLYVFGGYGYDSRAASGKYWLDF